MLALMHFRKSSIVKLIVLAGVFGLSACSETPTVTELTPTLAVNTPASLQHVSGNGQTGTVSTRLANDIIVKAFDTKGSPMGGVTITFSAASGSGSFSPSSAKTAADGTARTSWTLGSATGTHTGTAQSGKGKNTVKLALTATATAGEACLTVTPATSTLSAIGATVQLSSTSTKTGTVGWSSSNAAVATVSSTGLVTAKGNGSATITASLSGCVAATSSVTVAQTIASVAVTPATATVEANQFVQLAATAKDANGNQVTAASFTWASSSTAIATVDGSGLVNGKAAGAATVTASAGGKSGSSAVTVTTPLSGSGSDFGTIIRGVRPRGFGAGTYTLKQPTAGRVAYYVATTGNDANAGTSSAPFRTINRAAQVAVAGDVVNIANGTYQESVLVKNSGAAGAPIVFQAQNRGGVVLTGGQYTFRGHDFVGIMGATPQKYITIKGLIFRQYAGNDAGKIAVRATFAWTIEDCLFDNSAETAIAVSDHNVRVERSTLQFHYVHALNVYGGYADGTSPTDPNYRPVENLQLVDVVLRGNHTRNLAGSAVSSSRVIKISVSRGLLIDNMESYENYGSGLWLDNKNSNYIIRNSYFHHNLGVTATDGTKQKDAGRGLYLEKNWGTGTVENNVMADNEGAGIVVVSSNDVRFDNNALLRNEQSIQFLAMTGTGYEYFVLKNLTFRGTHMKGWRSTASVWARGGDFSLGPAAMGLSVDQSTYDTTNNAVQLAAWPAPLYGASTIPQMQTKYGWEYQGKTGSISY